MSTTFQNQEKSLKHPKDMLHSTRTVQYCMISKHTSPMKCKLGHDVWLCTLLRILSIIKTWVVRHAPNHYRIALSQKIISNSYQQAFFAHRWQTQQLLYQWPSVLMLDLWCISFKSDARELTSLLRLVTDWGQEIHAGFWWHLEMQQITWLPFCLWQALLHRRWHWSSDQLHSLLWIPSPLMS